MSDPERPAFVAAQARRIGPELSVRDYVFTADSEVDIQQALNKYTRRLNACAKREKGEDLECGVNVAPATSSSCKARNLSTLYGLYIPFVESEYLNIESPNQMGALGMFQFLPTTGQTYGLNVQDLLDVSKSADAAARYI